MFTKFTRRANWYVRIVLFTIKNNKTIQLYTAFISVYLSLEAFYIMNHKCIHNYVLNRLESFLSYIMRLSWYHSNQETLGHRPNFQISFQFSTSNIQFWFAWNVWGHVLSLLLADVSTKRLQSSCPSIIINIICF